MYTVDVEPYNHIDFLKLIEKAHKLHKQQNPDWITFLLYSIDIQYATYVYERDPTVFCTVYIGKLT